MPSSKKRKLRPKVLVSEEPASDGPELLEADTDLGGDVEIAGAIETAFVPAWARAAAPAPAAAAAEPAEAKAPKPKYQSSSLSKKQKKAKSVEPVASLDALVAKQKKEKRPKLTKEQRAALGPPAWRQECATCPSCVIKELPGKGRALVSTRPIKAGEVVVGELPAVHWVYASWRTRACGWCMKISEDRKPCEVRCEGCASVRWCSEACKAAHNEQGDHGVSCSFLATVGKEILGSDDASAVLSLACGVLALRAEGKEKEERLVTASSSDVALSSSESEAAAAVANLLLRFAPMGGMGLKFAAAVAEV
jgi:hypothetical protein